MSEGKAKDKTGLYVTQPDALPELMAGYWNAGIDIHIHSNGDAAQDSTLTAFEALSPGIEGQRVIIEHAALFTPVRSVNSHNYLPVCQRPVTMFAIWAA